MTLMYCIGAYILCSYIINYFLIRRLIKDYRCYLEADALSLLFLAISPISVICCVFEILSQLDYTWIERFACWLFGEEYDIT